MPLWTILELNNDLFLMFNSIKINRSQSYYFEGGFRLSVLKISCKFNNHFS